ncbi:MAG: hypothetical protein A2173_11220 [Planctomycetes bacterium RBG_13_44_8b]|nr:MAG: hypothetical protein A2173_11220 [Planctomycetes bacterium RBG_13_44_8b]
MINKKLLLLMLLFMSVTIINESSALTLPNTDSINQAMEIIQSAIEDAMALVKGAINGDPAQAGEAINEACSLIQEAIDQAHNLIQGTIAEDVNSIEDEIAEKIDSMQEDIEEMKENIQDAIEQMAQELAENMTIEPNEIDFAGSIVTGMVSLYELIGDDSFKINAESLGESILSIASGNLKGDEVFAIARLSQICDSPDNNIWWTTLCDFYRNIRDGAGGTNGYIAQLASSGSATAVFNLSYYTVVADYISDTDSKIWRRELINYLVQIDDNCNSPVMLLGIATWALAVTGELDNTLLDPLGTGALCWRNKTLKDLPEILASHQVPAGELYAGNFFCNFDHSYDVITGFPDFDAEDTLFATLGLIGAYKRNPNLEIETAIVAARQAIIEMISSNGNLCPQFGEQCSENYQLLAAEIIQVFRELIIALDMDP